MENEPIEIEKNEFGFQIMKNSLKHLIAINNRESKRFSEMNNTLNWSNTVIVAVFILFSKYIADMTVINCVDAIYFILSTVIFILLMLCYALYKLKYIQYENIIFQLTDKLTADLDITELNLKFKDLCIKVGFDNKGMSKEKTDKELIKIKHIRFYLNLYFKAALFMFFIAMILIPSYFTLKYFLL